MLKLLAVILSLAFALPALAQGYVCAEGGGNANKGNWSDEVFGWMVEKGNRGHVVILGAVPLENDERVPLFKKLGAASAVGMVITQENADTQETYDAIAKASVVFIRGGAQERYVNWWKGTKTDKAIHAVFDRGGVVGGTSAGCAVLGEITYDSIHGSLKPIDIIRDARSPDLTLTKEFLGLVPGVLFDTHFSERGRLPRLAVMLAHCRDELHVDVIGIGMDPRTALCVSPDGTAEVKGEGMATVLEFTPGTRTVIEAGKPPAVTSIFYTCVPKGAKFDLKTRTFILTNPLPIHQTLRGSGDIIFDGASEEGTLPIHYNPQSVPSSDDTTTPRAGPVPKWRAIPKQVAPSISSNTWSKPQPVMEDAKSFLAAGATVILLDPGNKARVNACGLLAIEPGPSTASSAVIIDASRVVKNEELPNSTYHAMLHILPPGWSMDLGSGEVSHPRAPTPP